jgi:hypothetical protein
MSDTTNTASNSKKTKVAKKSRALKNHGFNVPKKDCHYCVKGCIYIYKMIEEANKELLERLDVREAYNNFVECCLKYGDNLHSHIPSKYATYHHKLRPFLGCDESTQTYCLPFGFRYPKSSNSVINEENKKKEEDGTKNILEKYTVLYDLIKRDLIPYMEQKSWEVTCKEETTNCNSQIQVFNTRIKECEDVISRYQETISKYQGYIAELAQRAIDAQKPPVLTSFD